MNKTVNKSILSKIIFGIFIMCLGVIFTNSQNAFAANKYSVIFRSGAQGKFEDGSNKYVMQLEYGEVLNSEEGINEIPSIIMNEGSLYYFKGWNQEIPEKVTGRMEFVAQYGMLIDSVKYVVKYVDKDGKSLETQFTSYANSGDKITVYPVAIEGYTADETEKNIEIGSETVTATFVYTNNTTLNQNSEETDSEQNNNSGNNSTNDNNDTNSNDANNNDSNNNDSNSDNTNNSSDNVETDTDIQENVVINEDVIPANSTSTDTEFYNTTESNTEKVNSIYAKSEGLINNNNGGNNRLTALFVAIGAVIITFATCVFVYNRKKSKIK